MKNVTKLCLTGIIILFSASLFSQECIDAFRLGSSQQDEAQGITLDINGNIYLSGNFEGSVDFDPGSGEAILIALNSYDGYLARYDPDGNYIWAISIEGTEQVYCRKIVADAEGNLYMAGYFNGEADFDPSIDEYLLDAPEMDGFLAKYDPDGNFVWAFDIGNSNNGVAFDVCLDHVGNVWVSGTFKGDVDFDPSANEFILSGHGFMDAFMAKYTANGEFIWAGELGGETSLFYQPTLECDNSGNLYYTSYFLNQVDLDPGSGTFTGESAGDSDIFLLKLNSSGIFQWAFTMGGVMQDQSRDLQINDEQVLIAGFFEETIDFDPSQGEEIITSTGDYDAFISAYTLDGDFIWAKAIVGEDISQYQSIAVDEDQNIYLTGSFYGTSDFDPSSSIFEMTSTGDWDIFTSKYDDQGNFEWAIKAGGNDNDYGYNITTNNEEVMICGKFKGWAEFDHTGSGQTISSSGGFDAFLARYGAYSGAGVSEVNSGFEDIIFYPNPARDKLFISMASAGTDVHYQLLNLLGAQLSTGTVQGGITSIDVSDYAPGIYLLRINNGREAIVRKVLME